MSGLNDVAIRIAKDTVNTWKFRLWSINHLPSLAYWGVKVIELTAERCAVTVPFKRQSKNPFQSIYFAAQAGAAEFSTGGLVELHRAGKGKLSMLVVDSHMVFTKKARTTITFTCEQGLEVQKVIDGLTPGESTTLVLSTTGRDTDGEIVSKLDLTWSFLKKS